MERYQQRYAEAERTIRSVFTQPPCPRKQQNTKHADASYIPNALREALLQEPDGAAFLRVYEGLLLTGKFAGDTVTEREVSGLLSEHGIGRASVRKALKFAVSLSPKTHPMLSLI